MIGTFSSFSIIMLLLIFLPIMALAYEIMDTWR